jgi:O-antigen ligase
MLLLAMPLEAILPYGYSPPFVLFPPSALALAGLGLALLTVPFPQSLTRPERWLLAGSGFLFLINLGHFLHDGTQRFEHLAFGLLWVGVPVAAWRFGRTLTRILPAFMALALGLNLIRCLGQWAHGLEMTGLPGNRNWHAAFLLAATPVVWLFLRERLRHHARVRLAGLGALAGTTAWLLLEADSRAAWLAIGILVPVTLWVMRPHWRRRLATIAIMATAGLGVLLLLHGNRLADAIAEDVRIPLWASTLRIVGEHPWVGVSHAGFESALCDLKTPAYFLRAHAAQRSDHPHQQMLYMAAVVGLPGLLAWGYLWLYPLFLFLRPRRPWPRLHRHLAWGLLALLIVSCLDLALFVWPTLHIAGLYLGVLWTQVGRNEVRLPQAHQPDAPIPDAPSAGRAWCRRLAGILILGICLHESATAVQHSRLSGAAAWLKNEGRIPEAIATYRRAMAIRQDPEDIYHCAWLIFRHLDDPIQALDCIRRLDTTPYRNFIYNHRLQSICLEALGRLPEALEHARIDTIHYPVSIQGLHRRLKLEDTLGMTAAAAATAARLDWALRMKGLTPADLPALLRNPDFDLNFHRYLAQRDAAGAQSATPMAPAAP